MIMYCELADEGAEHIREATGVDIRQDSRVDFPEGELSEAEAIREAASIYIERAKVLGGDVTGLHVGDLASYILPASDTWPGDPSS